MDIAKVLKLDPGHYLVAVSGGVDSVALLDLLAKKYGAKGSNVRLTVAHFDHGIRDESKEDRRLVAEIAAAYKLPFVFAEGYLGSGASEDLARQARYEFLRKSQASAGARAIITAHHHDDNVETAVLNIIRGTGRKGLSSLRARSKDGIIRPLLHVPKARLKSYAEANGLKWNEDSTNASQDYRRNYVRGTILPKAVSKSPVKYRKLITLLRRQHEINESIDQALELILHTQPSRSSLRRKDVIGLPYKVSAELVAEWLRHNGKRQLSRWLVDRITVNARTARPGTEFLLDSHSKIKFGKNNIEFVRIQV